MYTLSIVPHPRWPPTKFDCSNVDHNINRYLERVLRTIWFHEISEPPVGEGGDVNPAYICKPSTFHWLGSYQSVTSLPSFNLLFSPFKATPICRKRFTSPVPSRNSHFRRKNYHFATLFFKAPLITRGSRLENCWKGDRDPWMRP